MDIFKKAKRSQIMSHVRGKDSKMELKFRKALWGRGFRYLKNSKKHFGKPDLVLSKYKTAIFLDSCFWHKCEQHYHAPATRTSFWIAKISKNKQRDSEVTRFYQKNDWHVIRIWGHDLKSTANLESIVNRIVSELLALQN